MEHSCRLSCWIQYGQGQLCALLEFHVDVRVRAGGHGHLPHRTPQEFVLDLQVVRSGRDTSDPERASAIADREVRVIEDVDVSVHPRVDVALETDVAGLCENAHR